MARDPSDPYDHGQHWYDCQTCAGLGQVVQPEIVYNHQTKSDELIYRAGTCRDCGGAKGEWR